MSRRYSHVPRSSQKKGSNGKLTQTRLGEDNVVPSQSVNLDEAVNNCVRYFVNNSGKTVYFRRGDIQKFSGIKSGQFQQMLEKATEVLRNVYGFNLLLCDPSNGSKAYILSNALPYINYNLDREAPSESEYKKVLLLLILSHICMAHSSVTEGSLFSFLKHFDIDNRRHPLFGQIKDYINNNLVKHKYLSMETDPVSKKVTYSWGIRAEKEISKMEVLKFVCKMYKDRQPKSWTNQFQRAKEQGFENDKLMDNTMDVDEA